MMVYCNCKGMICKDGNPRKAFGRRYRCPWCKRSLPWCFGAADDLPEVCDDCWALAHRSDDRAAILVPTAS